MINWSIWHISLHFWFFLPLWCLVQKKNYGLLILCFTYHQSILYCLVKMMNWLISYFNFRWGIWEQELNCKMKKVRLVWNNSLWNLERRRSMKLILSFEENTYLMVSNMWWCNETQTDEVSFQIQQANNFRATRNWVHGPVKKN